MTIKPWRGSVNGGDLITVGGVCNNTNNIAISFGVDVITSCRPINNSQVQCITPEMPNVGRIDTRISTDGGKSFGHGVQYLSGMYFSSKNNGCQLVCPLLSLAPKGRLSFQLVGFLLKMACKVHHFFHFTSVRITVRIFNTGTIWTDKRTVSHNL